MIVSEDFKKIFGVKYYDVICKYVEVIQNALDNYDVVIFMARKAYCFYKALKKIGLLVDNDKCTIFSSRVATYSNLDFSDKSVAVFEDVVVLGESLSEVINEAVFTDIKLDVYILACSKDFYENHEQSSIGNKFYSSLIIDSNELLELATLITNFIVYEMIPYNTDYPIYSFAFDDVDELKAIFYSNNYCSITDLIHSKNSFVEEGIIPLNERVLSKMLPEKVLDGTICKLRVYIDLKDNYCYLTPITIISKIPQNELNTIYKNMFGNANNSIVNSDINSLELKNKFKIICYKLSEKLFNSVYENILSEFVVEKINSEEELFTTKIKELNKITICESELMSYRTSLINDVSLYNSLGYSYDLLIENFCFNEKYISEFKREFITFDDIKDKLSIVTQDQTKLKILGSLILDVFVDNGVIVPRICFDDGYVFRKFKFGEVAKLTSYDFRLFAIFLGMYSDFIERTLDKTEIEKISVIFFRKYNNNFDVSNNEAEAYRICFSKFGPRMSSSSLLYRVSQGQALTDKLFDLDLIDKSNDKYNVITINQEDQFNKVGTMAQNIFARKLEKLYKYYTTAITKQPDAPVFALVNSYIRLLTLIAIGNNEKDKILSLIAEIDLIKCKKLNKIGNIKIIINALNSIIDGVLSGVWKYHCYLNENLLGDLFKLIVTSNNESNSLLAIDVFLEMALSDHPIKEKSFFNEIGEFLSETAIFFFHLCKYCNIKPHDDYTKTPYKNIIFSNKFDVIHNKYKEIFSRSNSEVHEFISQHINWIDNSANRIFDEYNIYDKTSSLQYEQYSECVVIFNINSKVILNKKYGEHRYFKHEDLLIFPVCNDTKEMVLDYVCHSLDDVDIKVLYYSSKNENRLLHAHSTCFSGEKFIEEVHTIVDFLRSNANSTISKEIYIMPKNDFNKKNFGTQKLSFRFIDSKLYSEGKNIYKYIFNNKEKDDSKMEIKNLTVNGNFYNIEKLTGNLDLLAEQCPDDKVKLYVESAQDAVQKKDEKKLNECLKWLGDNAIDFLKDVGATFIVELLKSGL